MAVDDYGSIRKRIKSLIRTETDIEGQTLFDQIEEMADDDGSDCSLMPF